MDRVRWRFLALILALAVPAVPASAQLLKKKTNERGGLQRVQPDGPVAEGATPGQIQRKMELHREGAAQTAISAKPMIQNMIIIPATADKLTDVGILAPGARVFLVGRYFGSGYGEIFIKAPSNYAFGPDYPYEIKLNGVVWESPEKVNGWIPWNVPKPMDRVNVSVVVRTKDGVNGTPYPAQFQVPSESAWVSRSDVELLSCGHDSNSYWCSVRNDPFSSEDDYKAGKCGFEHVFPTEGFSASADAALHGVHHNCTGAVGNDSGRDEYLIRLKDDWVFERVEATGLFPSPSVPKDAHQWQPTYNWNISPGTTLRYQLKIRKRRQAYFRDLY